MGEGTAVYAEKKRAWHWEYWMNRKSEENSETRSRFGATSVVIWVSILVVTYLLGSGPAVWLLAMNKLTPAGERAIWLVYSPVAWLYLKTPLHKPLGMYFHIWAPNEFDANGD